jgi:hypothetical protein
MSVKRKVTVPVGRLFMGGLVGTRGAAFSVGATFDGRRRHSWSRRDAAGPSRVHRVACMAMPGQGIVEPRSFMRDVDLTTR